jgi:hypothetical protein
LRLSRRGKLSSMSKLSARRFTLLCHGLGEIGFYLVLM